MYRRVSDFLNDWEEERSITKNVFAGLSNQSLALKDHENVRSIAVLAWHITTTLPEMLARTGLSVSGADPHSKAPGTVEEILSVYDSASRSVTEQVGTWNDASLDEKHDMYGEEWSKGQVLSVLIRHQAHHRGQLTILMRQAGLRFPGIYGPTREEWAQFNMPAME
jgi:uncharacterized damage-inducible protein DinB